MAVHPENATNNLTAAAMLSPDDSLSILIVNRNARPIEASFDKPVIDGVSYSHYDCYLFTREAMAASGDRMISSTATVEFAESSVTKLSIPAQSFMLLKGKTPKQ